MRYRNSPCSAPCSATKLLGYSLIELIIVVSLISVLTLVALPDIRLSQDEKLNLAAGRVAEALRYARTESIRTGEVHGVESAFNTEQVIATRADMTLPTPIALFTLIDPISKQPLDFNLAQDGATAGIDVLTEPFSYGLGDRPVILFDAQGMPFLKSSNTFYSLQDGLVELQYGGQQRNVRVAPITGRVTIE